MVIEEVDSYVIYLSPLSSTKHVKSCSMGENVSNYIVLIYILYTCSYRLAYDTSHATPKFIILLDLINILIYDIDSTEHENDSLLWFQL